MLGHTITATSPLRYADVLPGMQRGAKATLDRLLNNGLKVRGKSHRKVTGGDVSCSGILHVSSTLHFKNLDWRRRLPE